MTIALTCYQEMIDGFVQQKKDGNKPLTLSHWRFCSDTKNEKMISLLQSFAQAEEWPNNGGNDPSKYQSEVEALFMQLNQAMWEQEEKAGANNGNVTTNNNSKEISVVFGGKYSSNPNSIPEKLVELLVKQQSEQEKIYTVSRSTTVADNVPANVVHVAKQNLDQQDIGMKEFSNVMQQAIANNSDEQATLVFYFTLGRHVGVNPFQRNIHAATNFAKALLEQKSALAANRKFRVVITGTDATKANTHPDTTLELDGQSYTVPTYKIVAYNYVYAMSKLCQFYIIANALVELINKEELTKACQGFGLEQVIAKTTQHIVNAGENGAYSETDATNCQDGSYLTMKELDNISTQWNDVEKTLQQYLHVATDISICYTPLHAEPWTKNAFVKCQAESNGSPRAFLLQQVVRRTKNAISIEKAARAHFC